MNSISAVRLAVGAHPVRDSFGRMTIAHRVRSYAITAVLMLMANPSLAQDLFIRGAKVHTATAQGSVDNADVLVQGGIVRAVGPGLTAPAGTTVVEAKGRPLTPGLFAGFTALGLEDVSAETATVDSTLAFGAQLPPTEPQWRPEFDVVPAYNPRSTPVTVTRIAGHSFTVLSPGALPGGSFVAGQGAAVSLDGGFDAALDGSRALFVMLGSNAIALSGGSRAAQYMLLEQAIAEAGSDASAGEHALLTPGGRAAMARYLRDGRVVFHVDRAADIRQALALAGRVGFRPIIVGGTEAWAVAEELAAAQVPVFVDALVNLPGNFDQLGARLDNAAKLHAAGVAVGFSQGGDATHNARKIRQLAGNAAANGLPWEVALAGLTRVPAEAFGLGDRLGTIAPGRRADLVLWSGDPLEVTSVAEQVWFSGKPATMRSRQTELRDRYLRPEGALPRAYP